jgi:hypothetical protein
LSLVVTSTLVLSLPGAPHLGEAPNFVIYKTRLEVTNTLACYKNELITAVKSFIIQAPSPPILSKIVSVIKARAGRPIKIFVFGTAVLL